VDESELDNAIAPEEAEAEEAGGDAQAPSAAAATGAETAAEVGEPERRASLALLRREAVLAALKDVGGKRVLDLGCGGGAVAQALLHDRFFTEILGGAVSARARRT